MNSWVKSLLAGGIVALLVFFLWDKLINRKTSGKYSMQYTVRVTPDKDATHPLSLPKITELLERRLETRGYGHTIKSTGDDTILVSLTGVEDTLSPPGILTYTGGVQFSEVYLFTELVPLLTEAVRVLDEPSPSRVKNSTAPAKTDSMSKPVRKLSDSIEAIDKIPEENAPARELIDFTIPYQDHSGKIIYPASPGSVKLKDTAAVRELFGVEKVKSLAPPDMQLCFGEPATNPRADKEEAKVPLFFLRTKSGPAKTSLDHTDISDAKTDFIGEGKVEIILHFNSNGTRKWAALTRDNVGRPIAIVINGTVISAPTVLAPIEEGVASISGNYTMEEADLVAMGLRSGKLPATLAIIAADKQEEAARGGNSSKLVTTLIIFVVFSGLARFIFKTLKSTRTTTA